MPDGLGEPLLSEKDRDAPTLREALAAGALPDFAALEARRRERAAAFAATASTGEAR